MSHVDRVSYKFINAFVIGGRYRYDRYSQHHLHMVDVDGTAVFTHLIHHVKGNHHGDAYLKKLHRKIQIALDVRGIDDINDTGGFILKNEIS